MIWIPAVLLWAPTLFDQSVVRILARDFPQAQFVLATVGNPEVLGSHWEALDSAIPMGSLMKPFTAMALAPNSALVRCKPKECWLPKGHGSLDLAGAIAQSCNSYFLQRAASISTDAVRAIAARFHLPVPSNTDASTLIGLGRDWQVQPERMALAYAALAQAHDAGPVMSGMRRSAQSGTARLVGGSAFAKTGTAPCSHRQKAPGDGFVAIVFPTVAPKYVLLVKVHGVSGAEAARTAVKMLDVLRYGK